jgi:hypothetical protein
MAGPCPRSRFQSERGAQNRLTNSEEIKGKASQLLSVQFEPKPTSLAPCWAWTHAMPYRVCSGNSGARMRHGAVCSRCSLRHESNKPGYVATSGPDCALHDTRVRSSGDQTASVRRLASDPAGHHRSTPPSSYRVPHQRHKWLARILALSFGDFWLSVSSRGTYRRPLHKRIDRRTDPLPRMPGRRSVGKRVAPSIRQSEKRGVGWSRPRRVFSRPWCAGAEGSPCPT